MEMTGTANSAHGGAPIATRTALFVPLAGSLMGMVLGAMVFVVTAVVLVVTRGYAPGVLPNLIEKLAADFYVTLGVIAAFYVPILWLMWSAAKRDGWRVLARFFPASSARTVLLAAAAGVVITLLCLVLEEHLTKTYGLRFVPTDMERRIAPSTLLDLVPAIAVVALFGPVVEELYFRGFLLTWLRQKMPALVAVVVSALVFTLVHGLMFTHPDVTGWIGSGEILVAGLAMGFLAVRTGSLWPSFALHAAYNAAILVAALLWPT